MANIPIVAVVAVAIVLIAEIVGIAALVFILTRIVPTYRNRPRTLTIRNADGSLADIYSEPAGDVAAANPIDLDLADGVTFYTTGGQYRLKIRSKP